MAVSAANPTHRRNRHDDIQENPKNGRQNAAVSRCWRRGGRGAWVGFAALTATLRRPESIGSGLSDGVVRGCLMVGQMRGRHACGMSEYRRWWVPGGTYFFTVNLADRSQRLLVERFDALRDVACAVRHAHAFEIVAWVVMPNHLHATWTLPDGDQDFARRWMLIKQSFSRSVPAGERVSASRRRTGERGIWQRRYWEHLIRDERDLQNHIEYIHFNPVKHGWAQRPGDWPYSSFHRFVLEGVLPADWAGSPDPLR